MGKMKMHTVQKNLLNRKTKGPTVLMAVDFSHCSRLALRQAKSWALSNNGKIVVLHVIDQDFVRHCIQQHLGVEEEIKKKLFINSKNKLRRFLRGEGMDENVFYKEATFFSVDELVENMNLSGFRNLTFNQTIFGTLAETPKDEAVKSGHGEGSFVVIRGRKEPLQEMEC